MTDIPIDWNLAQPAQSLDFVPSALEGVQAGQQMRAASALQGIDINNPDSLNKGMSNLVRAGAADQATALMGLQLNRAAYSTLPAFQAFLAGHGPDQGQQTAPTAPPTASPQGQAAPDPSKVAAVTTGMAQDVRAYGSTSPDQQPAMAASLKAKYLPMGVPEAAIDSALAHASTPEGATELANHYDASAGALTGNAPQDATHLQPPGNTFGWAQDFLAHPAYQTAIGLFKKAGIDYGGLTSTALALQQPYQAEAARLAYAPAEKQVEVAGNVSQAQQTLPIDVAKEGASAALRVAATAPYTPVTYTGPDGQTITTTAAQFAAQAAAAGPKGIVSAGPGIATQHDMAGQAEALTTAAAQAQANLKDASKHIAEGQALLGLANAVGTGKYTEALSQAAQFLPITHTAQQYAADSSLLAQDLSASFKNALGSLSVPRVASEANSILGGIPKNTSPQDQVKFYAAGLLALSQYNQKHDNWTQGWAADPSKPRSLSQADAAWQASPDGRASMFTMPAFQGLKIGGKPAVEPFPYKGKTYLAVLPGLLKNTFVPAN